MEHGELWDALTDMKRKLYRLERRLGQQEEAIIWLAKREAVRTEGIPSVEGMPQLVYEAVKLAA